MLLNNCKVFTFKNSVYVYDSENKLYLLSNKGAIQNIALPISTNNVVVTKDLILLWNDKESVNSVLLVSEGDNTWKNIMILNKKLLNIFVHNDQVFVLLKVFEDSSVDNKLELKLLKDVKTVVDLKLYKDRCEDIDIEFVNDDVMLIKQKLKKETFYYKDSENIERLCFINPVFLYNLKFSMNSNNKVHCDYLLKNISLSDDTFKLKELNVSEQVYEKLIRKEMYLNDVEGFEYKETSIVVNNVIENTPVSYVEDQTQQNNIDLFGKGFSLS